MHIFISVCIAILVLCALSIIILLVRVTEPACRAFLGDAVFYLMIAIFLALNFFIETSIVFEIPLLGAILGILSTLAMARILSKGRR